jgi:KDO2-lipid IV(A) lauroyltransferase
MSKPRSKITDYAVCLAVRLVVCVLQALSFKTACQVARLLAWLADRVDKRHRLVALDNLRQAFPGKYSDAELEQMVRNVYRHFCTVLVEITHLPRRLHVTNWKQHINLDNGKEFVDSLLTGRPLLIVTGHLGNWEMAGYALGLLGFTTYAIARPLDNPYLDDFLRDFRERTGQKILAKKGDFEQMQAVLDGGGVLATLADQDAGQRGQFVEFFGRLASTHKAVALLALEHNVPLAVVGTVKAGDKYLVKAEELILPEEYVGKADPVRDITRRFTAALERLVRGHPQQYFWLHRRWKTPAPVAKARKRPAAA